MRKQNKNVFRNKTQLSLKELIGLKEWQAIQDNFSSITNVGLRTFDSEGNPLTSPSGESRLCSTLAKESSLRNELLGMCLPTFLGGKAIVDRNLSFICFPGFHNFITPLKLKDKIFGYVIIGPVILVMRKAKEDYQQIAEALHLSLDDVWDAVLGLKVISFHGIQSLVELIKDMGEYILRLSYQSITKGRVIPQDMSKLNRLLEALLDVAFQVTEADIGSIMLLDKKGEKLTIQASRGIPEEITLKTKVKVGEGISGIAAKEGESLLFDNNTQDSRIKPYLSRPYIGSSMVVPIKLKRQTWGVMNLGALKASAVRFNTNNLQLVNRLINLATVALHE